jgi:hypothetical protein
MAMIVLSLAIFAAFWSRSAWPTYWPGDRDPHGFGHARPSFSTSFGPQPKGLQWAEDEGEDDRGHVLAHRRELLDDDDAEL